MRGAASGPPVGAVTMRERLPRVPPVSRRVEPVEGLPGVLAHLRIGVPGRPLQRRGRAARRRAIRPSARAACCRTAPFGSASAALSGSTADSAGGPIRPSVRAARQRRSASSLCSASTRAGTAPAADGPIRARAPATTAFVSSATRRAEVGDRDRRGASQVAEAPGGEGHDVAVLAASAPTSRGTSSAVDSIRASARADAARTASLGSARAEKSAGVAPRPAAPRPPSAAAHSARTPAEGCPPRAAASAAGSLARSPSAPRSTSATASPGGRSPLAWSVSATSAAPAGLKWS